MVQFKENNPNSNNMQAVNINPYPPLVTAPTQSEHIVQVAPPVQYAHVVQVMPPVQTEHIVQTASTCPAAYTAPVCPAVQMTVAQTTSSVTVAGCDLYTAPWPTIIISILGAVLIIYTAVAPNLDSNRRIFGVVLLILWTLIWALLLWVIWRECRQATSWWLLLIPVIAMILFFVLIIVLNLGA